MMTTSISTVLRLREGRDDGVYVELVIDPAVLDKDDQFPYSAGAKKASLEPSGEKDASFMPNTVRFG
jgi:hypothetical protein